MGSVTKLRSGTVTTGVVLLLAGILLQRFIYIATTERLFLGLIPLALILGAALLDLLHYRAQLTRLEGRVDRLDEDIQARSQELLGGPEDRRRELDTWAIAGFYLLPTLVAIGLTICGWPDPNRTTEDRDHPERRGDPGPPPEVVVGPRAASGSTWPDRDGGNREEPRLA